MYCRDDETENASGIDSPYEETGIRDWKRVPVFILMERGSGGLTRI
jgi:hypothetical protein